MSRQQNCHFFANKLSIIHFTDFDVAMLCNQLFRRLMVIFSSPNFWSPIPISWVQRLMPFWIENGKPLLFTPRSIVQQERHLRSYSKLPYMRAHTRGNDRPDIGTH